MLILSTMRHWLPQRLDREGVLVSRLRTAKTRRLKRMRHAVRPSGVWRLTARLWGASGSVNPHFIGAAQTNGDEEASTPASVVSRSAPRWLAFVWPPGGQPLAHDDTP